MEGQIRKFSIEKALKKDKEDFISWVQKKALEFPKTLYKFGHLDLGKSKVNLSMTNAKRFVALPQKRIYFHLYYMPS